MSEPQTANQTEVATSSVDKLVGMLDAEQMSAMETFIQKVGKEHAVQRVNAALIDGYIADLDAVISAQMDEILHNKDFQALESAWRGLHHLVKQAEFSKPVVFEILDCPKEELFSDLHGAAGDEGIENQSGQFEKVYWGAYDKYGGHPYTTIVADYQFDNTPDDIQLLKYMSILGETAQLPFLANASAKFFGSEKMEDVMKQRSLVQQIKDGKQYTAWHSFRLDDRSKYIGLCLPRFLGRLPYGPETDPTKNFTYKEAVIDDKGEDKSLWCSASFALAGNMVKSFEKWGWSVKIVGLDSGGKVEDLPMAFYEEDGQKKPKVPLEAAVGQAKDSELCGLGFIPLAHWDRTDYACFFEMPSVLEAWQDKKDPIGSANRSVGSRLQYTLLVTRIAHYLKYRQVRFVGRNASSGTIKQDLTDWLNTLVAGGASPDEKQIAERPLKSFTLEVRELEEKPGYFQIDAEFKPHVAIVGMDLNLRLVAYHSNEDRKKK